MRISKSLTASVLVAGLTLGMGSVSMLAITSGEAVAKSENAEGRGKPENPGEKGQAKKAEKANSNSGTKGKSETAGSNGRGKIASQLKNLNAVCANDKAFEHAAEGSNVSNIGVYKKELGDTDAKRLEVADQAEVVAGNDLAASDDPAYYTSDTGEAAEIQAKIDLIADELLALGTERDGMLWPDGDADGYAAAIQDLIDNNDDYDAVEDIPQEVIDTLIAEHNDPINESYGDAIDELATLSALLAELKTEKMEEDDALLAASHGRDLLEPGSDALLALQDAARNGC